MLKTGLLCWLVALLMLGTGQAWAALTALAVGGACLAGEVLRYLRGVLRS